MAKIGKIFFIFCFVLWSAISANASSVKVSAYADQEEVGLGDSVAVTVQVTSSESFEAGEPQVPDLSAFEMLNTWTSNSTSSKLIQGQNGMEFVSVKAVEFHYMLAPRKEGALSIPAFEVTVDGKIYRTAPFTIRVSRQATRPQQRGGMPDVDEIDEAEKIFNELLRRRGGALPSPSVVPKNINESFFIHLDLDKKEVYEGEQITANWYIYSRGNLLALDRLKFPDLKGFWKEIIEEVPALNFTQEVLNGVAYRKALLASHALFPIKSGESVIDEYKIKATVQLAVSPFGTFGYGQPYSYARSSDRVTIKVKPLPQEGKPQDFSGAVGQFEVQANVDNKLVPINQPFSFKVRFEGEGNAKLIELPNFELPPGLERYDTKSDAKFFKNGRSYKEFEVLMIPRDPGEMTIPGLTIALFDPKTGKYYTRKTEPIPLKITGQKLAEATVPTVETKPSATEPDKLQLPPIMMAYQGSSVLSISWPIFVGFSLFSLLALGWKGRRELGHQEKKATIHVLLRERMKGVHKAVKAGQDRQATAQMTNVIYAVLGAISGEGGASTELKVLLEKAPPSLRRDLGDELAKTLEIFQFLTFAPEEALKNQSPPAQVAAEISKAEKLLNRAIDHLTSES